MRDAVPLTTMPAGDIFAYAGIGLLAGIILWLLALGLFVRQPQNPQVNLFVLLLTMLTIFLTGFFDTISTHKFVWAWLPASTLTGGSWAC